MHFRNTVFRILDCYNEMLHKNTTTKVSLLKEKELVKIWVS